MVDGRRIVGWFCEGTVCAVENGETDCRTNRRAIGTDSVYANLPEKLLADSRLDEFVGFCAAILPGRLEGVHRRGCGFSAHQRRDALFSVVQASGIDFERPVNLLDPDEPHHLVGEGQGG